MAHCSGLDLKVLDNIKEVSASSKRITYHRFGQILVDALQRTLAQYLNSPEYRLLFRKGRRSLATLVSFKPWTMIVLDNSNSQIPLPAYPSFVHIDKNEANAMVITSVLCTVFHFFRQASELLAYLQSTHIDLLQRYLDKQGDGHLLR
jgi:hypothetical protein